MFYCQSLSEELEAPHHINLSIGVTHVADNGAVLHTVQLVPGHHILIPYRKTYVKSSNQHQRCIHIAPTSAKPSGVLQIMYLK